MPLANSQFIPLIDGGYWGAYLNGEPVTCDALRCGPNSIDVSVSEHLIEVVPRDGVIRLHDEDSQTFIHHNCKNGFVLEPGKHYLGCTEQSFDCNAPVIINDEEAYFVQMLEGRSSVARVGLSTHENAGFGDFGFNRPWVMEFSVKLRTEITAGDYLAQISFWPLIGKPWGAYSGAYAEQTGPQPARLGRERFGRAGEGA